MSNYVSRQPYPGNPGQTSPLCTLLEGAAMKLKQFTILLSLSVTFLYGGASAAGPLLDLALAGEANWLGIAGATPAMMSYNATTDILTATAPLGGINPAQACPFRVGDCTVRDIIGSFSMTVIVDEVGIDHGGVFVWIGQSAELGIAAPTTLLSGSIVDLENDFGCRCRLLLATVGFIDPHLRASVGPTASALLSFVGPGRCVQAPGVAPYACDFSGPTATEAPVIFGFAHKVPEPS